MRFRVVLLAICSAFGVCANRVWTDEEKSTDLPGQRVTLVGQMTLSEALDQFERQSRDVGNRLLDLRPLFGQSREDPRLDLNLREVSFWQACDQLAQLAGLQLAILPPTAERETTVGLIVPASKPLLPSAPVVYTGPFRLRIPEIQALRHFEDPNLSRLEVSLELACEPRYLPIWLQVGRESVRWRIGDTSEQIAEQLGQGTIKWLGEGALCWRLRLPLPERNVVRLDTLTVQAIALVAPKRLPLRLPPKVSQTPMRLEDVQVSVLRASYDASAEQWQLQLRLDYPPANGRRGFSLESYHTWIMDASQFWLRHENGQPAWPTARPPIVAVEGRHAFTLELVFPAPEKKQPADAQKWELYGLIPATPLVVPIQATFRDVLLP